MTKDGKIHIFQDRKNFTSYLIDNNVCGTEVYIDPKTGGKESIIISILF